MAEYLDGELYDADALAAQEEIDSLRRRLYELECRHDQTKRRIREPLMLMARRDQWEVVESAKFRAREAEVKLAEANARIAVLEATVAERDASIATLTVERDDARKVQVIPAGDTLEKIQRQRAEWARHHQLYEARITELKSCLMQTDAGRLAYDNLCKENRLRRVLDIIERCASFEDVKRHVRALVAVPENSQGSNDNGKRAEKAPKEPQAR